MQGDKLASGGASATFPAGHAKKDDPIQFNWMPVTKESCAVQAEDSWQAAATFSPDHEAILAKGCPLNDRVLLRRIKEDETKAIATADAYKEQPDRGEVLAVGDCMVLGNEVRPIPLNKGDIVQFGRYNAEDIEIDGEMLVLVSAFDCRYRF